MKEAGRRSPRDTKTYAGILALQTTVKMGRKACLHLGHDGSIYIWDRKASAQSVRISRSDFNKFVKYYETAQRLREER